MVRFGKDKLVIEIPCNGENVADQYQGLQNALYDVFWLSTTEENRPGAMGANWLAGYLGPAIAELEPVAKDLLNQLADTATKGPSTSPAHFTDEELVTLLEGMEISRLKELLRRIDLFTPPANQVDNQ